MSVAFVTDISLRRESERALQESHQELRELAANLLNVQDGERRRIARELHDDVLQELASLHTGIQQALVDAEGESPAIRARLQTLANQARQVSDEVRRVARGLHPSIIEDLGLRAALSTLVAQFGRSHGIAAHFSSKGATRGLDAEYASCLYRVAQECLQNVRKHAGAASVQVALSATRGLVALTVVDDGAGLTARHKPGHLGLVSMRERLRAVGGVLLVTSEKGQGTRVRAEIPVVRRRRA
jgi:signal transduction histidine kinase